VADPIVRVRIVAEDRAAATITRVQESTRGLQTELRRLGISLERDVNANLRRNVVVLEEARKAYEAGSITLRDFTRAQAAVAAQNEALRARLAGTGAAAASSGASFAGLGSTLGALALRFGAVLGATTALARGFRAIVRDTPQFQALGAELGDLAQRFTTAASQAIELHGAFGQASSGAKGFEDAFTRAGAAAGSTLVVAGEAVSVLAEGVGRGLAFLRESVLGIAQIVGTAGDAIQKLTGIHLGAEAAADRHAAGLARLHRILTEEALALKETAGFARELGVTLESQVTGQLDRNAEALERARAAAQQGVITWEDYGRLAAAAAERSRELEEGLRGTTAALGEQTDGSAALGGALRDLSQEQRAAALEHDRFAQSALRAAQAQAQLNAQVGRVVARDPRNQGDVDRAVAAGNQPYLGGTRIRTVDGGSRLI
jgi:hypothetical protein